MCLEQNIENRRIIVSQHDTMIMCMISTYAARIYEELAESVIISGIQPQCGFQRQFGIPYDPTIEKDLATYTDIGDSTCLLVAEGIIIYNCGSHR